ncbi:MAG: hypothetical protein F9K46_02185 [Anaerolineae bacterium]|nr:MAG: hypothetical protein F9K46_02185 [Anaerolineae bacterium]
MTSTPDHKRQQQRQNKKTALPWRDRARPESRAPCSCTLAVIAFPLHRPQTIAASPLQSKAETL